LSGGNLTLAVAAVSAATVGGTRPSGPHLALRPTAAAAEPVAGVFDDDLLA
jgi:hypothetical protein